MAFPAVSQQSGTATGQFPIKVAAVVGFLIFVEFTSGFVQGYYLPLFGAIAKHLATSDADITWFTTVQTLAAGVSVPVLAKLGDVFGHRRILRLAVLAVLVGALAVAFAPNFAVALLGRILMGPLAVWLPLEIALVQSRITNGTARRSIGLLVSALTIGSVIGTLAAGFFSSLLDSTMWTLFVPCPILAACLLVVLFLIPESTVRTFPAIDYLGFVGLAAIMILLLWGLRQAQDRGFSSPLTLLTLLAALVIGAAWLRWELRAKAPAVNLALVRSRQLWPAYLTAFLFGVVLFGTQTITTTFLAARPAVIGYGFGLDPGQISFITGGSSLLSTVGAALFSYLAKPLQMRGVLILAALLSALGNLTILLGHSSMLLVLISLAISGIGTGLLLGALPSVVAEAAPKDQTGIASGIYNSLKTLGGSAAGAVFAVVLSGFALSGSRASSIEGYSVVWAICCGAFLVSAIALLFIKTSNPSVEREKQNV